jgi:hypothetical protein
MKRSKFSTFLLATVMAASVLGMSTHAADSPQLDTGVYVEAGGLIKYFLGFTGVTTADWNNDGKQDLIVAGAIIDEPGFKSGKVRVYLNQGEDHRPSFTSYFDVQSFGAPIELWGGS